MAKKKKNKINYLKLLANIFYSTLLLTIIFASSWWSGLKEDDKIKIRISDTNILNIETYESLISNVIENENIDNKITKITKVIEDHPYVKAARVSKHYPSEIRIEIMEREPIAIVNIDPIFLFLIDYCKVLHIDFSILIIVIYIQSLLQILPCYHKGIVPYLY